MSQAPPHQKSTARVFAIDAEVVILGAGFSGSLLAVHLARAADGPSVVLVDKSHAHGPGLAYGAAGAHHPLNVPAGRMSAFPDEPDHFLRWLNSRPEDLTEFGLERVEPGDFLPRPLYGRYLTSLLKEQVRRSGRLRLVDAEARDITRADDGAFVLSFTGGARLRARQVVLALGNFPAANPPGIDPDIGDAWLPSPWNVQPNRAPASRGDILILGTGLTTLDVLGTLHQANFRGHVHLLSRRGLLPAPHLPLPAHSLRFSWSPPPGGVRALLTTVRAEIRRAAAWGLDWRVVIDSLRPDTQAIWRSWTPEEKRRFLRHARPYWETARHRAAPRALAPLESLRAWNRLHVHRGRLLRLERLGDHVDATFQPRRQGPEVTLRVAAVVNCTGPATDLTKVESPLLRQLILRGLIRPDPLGLGLETGEGGDVLGADALPVPGLHALGALRKGTLWESTAVPELRAQAAALAATLLTGHRVPATKAGASEPSAELPELREVWAYEI